MKKQYTILLVLLLIFGVSFAMATSPPGQWLGSVKINGNDANGTLVMPYQSSNYSLISNYQNPAGGTNPPQGSYAIQVWATLGTNVFFGIGTMVADQVPMAWSSDFKALNLTFTDSDNDSYAVGYSGYTGTDKDCNDSNPNISPGATEVCNGVDDNCNGQIDEGLDCTAPELSILSPTTSAYINSRTIPVNFTASDLHFNYVKAELYDVADTIVATQITTETSGIVNILAPSDGVYTIKLTAYDNASHETSLSESQLLVDSDNTITVGLANADFATIQEAINRAIAGNTISVASGTYDELLNINKEIKLVGSGAPSTHLNYEIGGIEDHINLISVNSDDVVIDGFNVSSANASGIILNGHDNVTIKNNDLQGNNYGIYINQAESDISNNINIETNSINGNQEGIRLDAGEGIVVFKNKIYDNVQPTTGLHNGADAFVDARKNWWNSAEGPYQETINPSGIEGSIYGNVTFSPWCSNEACTEFKTVSVLSDGISDAFDTGLLTTSGDRENSTNVSVEQDIIISVPAGGQNSTVSLPTGTIITMSDGSNINASLLSVADVSESSLSGLGSGVVANGALQWGIANHGLVFSQPITLRIFVGTSFNGVTLDVTRSISGTGSWTSDGVSPATCVVTSGYCTFNATKASYYAATTTTPAVTVSGGGGGGGGGTSCNTTWTCAAWTSCSSGKQTRTCSLVNPVCSATTAKPVESQSCIAAGAEAVTPTETPVQQPIEQPIQNAVEPTGNAAAPTTTGNAAAPTNQLTGNAVATPSSNGITGNVVAIGPIKMSQTAAWISGIILLAIIVAVVMWFVMNRRHKKKHKE